MKGEINQGNDTSPEDKNPLREQALRIIKEDIGEIKAKGEIGLTLFRGSELGKLAGEITMAYKLGLITEAEAKEIGLDVLKSE